MINPPESAPLPWRRAYTLGMTDLVDANGDPVIITDESGGLIVDPDVWEFLLAAVNKPSQIVAALARMPSGYGLTAVDGQTASYERLSEKDCRGGTDAGDGSDYEFSNHGQAGRKD
ncbi:hypothetical protein EB230_17335 [Mesorhizobium sp. NZP2234]|uniref:hypothetical protein n=1 Tax=Mesorhizobium sp. NZP2234 TaxID=2483402 RepID=UPI001555E533|nr:hypothetical protein [Mesorhizobium sp. NZP2234]QKC89972.1 hypothetical protein EB230_17335 [Mesorhizobium sp. NZP2234]